MHFRNLLDCPYVTRTGLLFNPYSEALIWLIIHPQTELYELQQLSDGEDSSPPHNPSLCLLKSLRTLLRFVGSYFVGSYFVYPTCVTDK